MTKAELIERVAVATDVTKKQAEAIVDTIFEAIIRSLKGGQKIELRGFGSFRLRERGGVARRVPGPEGIRAPQPVSLHEWPSHGRTLRASRPSLGLRNRDLERAHLDRGTRGEDPDRQLS